MGRHRWTSRLTVEECPLHLCVASLHRAHMFTCPLGTISTLSWTGPHGEWLGRLECRFDERGNAGSALYIRPQLIRFGTPVDEQTIRITKVRPHLGGERYWFLCACGRRIGRLYLPAGQRVFRCRHCYNLTYESAQKHDQRVYDLANDPPAMLLVLHGHGGRRPKFFLGMKALILHLHRQSMLQRKSAPYNQRRMS